jgi:hypothetical protein
MSLSHAATGPSSPLIRPSPDGSLRSDATLTNAASWYTSAWTRPEVEALLRTGGG